MNLYLIKRVDHVGYDEYDAFVIAAVSEEEARAATSEADKWGRSGSWEDSGWATVEWLGSSLYGEARVILGSFNAG